MSDNHLWAFDWHGDELGWPLTFLDIGHSTSTSDIVIAEKMFGLGKYAFHTTYFLIIIIIIIIIIITAIIWWIQPPPYCLYHKHCKNNILFIFIFIRHKAAINNTQRERDTQKHTDRQITVWLKTHHYTRQLIQYIRINVALYQCIVDHLKV